MKKIYKILSIIFILQYSFIPLFSQIEEKTGDEKPYKIINLTEVAKSVTGSNGDLHLGNFTGIEDDNSLEDELDAITSKIKTTLGYNAYDVGLPSNSKDRENGVEEVLEMAESSDINADKYLLYSYFLDEAELSMACKIVDKDNPDDGKLLTISTILNSTIQSESEKDFSFLDKTSIEIYCLKLFLNYFGAQDIILPSSEANLISNTKTTIGENSTYVALSGIVFTDESIESLIYWDAINEKHSPSGGSSVNVNGLLYGFVKDKKTYTGRCNKDSPSIFTGYAYKDENGEDHTYNPPIIIALPDISAEVTIGITFEHCPKLESCSHHDYIVEMKTYAIPDPNPDVNQLRGSFSSYEKLIGYIYKIKLNTLIYKYASDWQEFKKVGDKPLFDPINIIYTHENPCEAIPVSYPTFKSDYITRFTNASPLYYITEIEGQKMLLFYGPEPDKKMIAVKVDEDTDLINDSRASYYHFNSYCYRWEPIIFRTPAETDLFNLIGSDLTQLLTDPHFQILLAQGTLCVIGVVATGGIATAVILVADAGLSIMDGALYWQEGDKSGAALAFGGAVLGASGVAFNKLKILLRNKDKLKFIEPESLLSKLGLDDVTKSKFYEDLKITTEAAQTKGTLGPNKWAAYFAEHEEAAVNAWKGLFNTSLRTDIPWLTRASKWLDEGAEFAADGSAKLSKNGQQILEVKNNKILPDKYDYPVSGGTPVGEASNGYQVVKNGDDLSVRRVPETSGYSQSEVNFLTELPDGHALHRHGPDVTDDALIKRSTTNIAPDGADAPPAGGLSTKFSSEQAVKDAIENVKPGTPAFDAKVQKPNGLWEVEAPGNYGYGFKPNGTGGPQQMLKVTAVYKEMPDGSFKLFTMYPNK